MKITFLAPIADMSGGARVIHIYATRLQARGHSVTVVVRPPRTVTFRERMREIVKGTVAPDKVSKTHYGEQAYELRVLDRYRPIAAGDLPNADVVIATWWETAEWMMQLGPEKGRQVHFVQGYEAFKSMPAARVDAVLAAPIFKITISRWLEGLLRDRFGNHNVVRISNGVDLDQFYAPPRGRQMRPTIGMLYSKTDCKDCRTGFAAFELLRQRLPNARLVTFGSVLPSVGLPLPKGALNTILPPQDQIRDIYAQCDVWLCSSTEEGFFLPMLEAMACRCPVISTPVGGAIEIIEEGVNGFIVPIGDAEQMASRIHEFFSLPTVQWRALSDAAYSTAKNFDWEKAANAFEAALLVD